MILANSIIKLYLNKKIRKEYEEKAKKRVEALKVEKLISKYKNILN